jgi:hypothetical protein
VPAYYFSPLFRQALFGQQLTTIAWLYEIRHKVMQHKHLSSAIEKIQEGWYLSKSFVFKGYSCQSEILLSIGRPFANCL